LAHEDQSDAPAPVIEGDGVGVPLPSDELGVVGEAEFERLCGRAKLICNKSSRDRTGWDFFVEFPMPEATSALPLDQRPPTACHVQLKSTTAWGPVVLRLSSAERLAKNVLPGIIVVFRLSPDGETHSGYLIHLVGPPLARILRRLRTAQANRAFAVNHAKISFDYRKFGVRFDATPGGLRQALAGACGPDRDAYVTEKQRQLDQLGYENGGLEAEAIFWVEGAKQLGNILIGLEPLRPERLQAFDTRFGIRIPYEGPAFDELEELRLEPPLMGPCAVVVRGPTLQPPALFSGQMFAGPQVEGLDAPWLLVRHDDFNLTFRSNAMSFETLGDFDSRVRTLDAWIQLVRALSYLADGHGVFSITAEFNHLAPIEMPLGTKLDGPFLDRLPAMLRLLEGWRRLLDLAGVSANEPFSVRDLWAARDVGLAVDLMFGAPPTAWFAFYSEDLDNPPERVDALYFNTCRLGGAAVSYGVRLTLQLEEGASRQEYRSGSFLPLDARPAVPDLEDYAEELANAHGLTILINPANITEVEPPPAAPGAGMDSIRGRTPKLRNE